MFLSTLLGTLDLLPIVAVQSRYLQSLQNACQRFLGDLICLNIDKELVASFLVI